MNRSRFVSKPETMSGECIVCHKNGELTDEHIIPKALGGCMHSYHVCKECNSRLGAAVDTLITNHFFTSFARYKYQLCGESNKSVRHPLEGMYSDENGVRYNVRKEDGGLAPHIVPTGVKMNDDGRGLSFTVDAADEEKIDGIVKKFCRRNGLSLNGQRTERVVQSPSPSLRAEMVVDVAEYKLGLLKIAYEFCAELLDGYSDDMDGRMVADILLKADASRLDEMRVIERGDVLKKVIGDYVDLDGDFRHFIMLTNASGGTFCFVRLFDVFTVGFRMSTKEWNFPEGFVLAINDVREKKVDLFSLPELVARKNPVMFR